MCKKKEKYQIIGEKVINDLTHKKNRKPELIEKENSIEDKG